MDATSPIPIFLINLDRDGHRLYHMRRQFDAAGEKFQRISGVVGRQTPEDLRDQFPPSDLADGLVGNYASHLVSAQTLLRNGIEAGVVLEDDLNIDADCFSDVVFSAVNCAPNGWDIINILSDPTSAMLKVADLTCGRSLVRYSRCPWDCAGYVISTSGARKLLKWKSRTRGMDFEMRHPWNFGFNFFGVSPPIAKYEKFESSVDALSSKPRPIPMVQQSLAGLLWYCHSLGAAGTIKCVSSNLRASAAKKTGGPKGRGPIIT